MSSNYNFSFSFHLYNFIKTKFEAQLVIVELLPHKSIFTAGYSAVIHIHCVVEECTVVVENIYLIFHNKNF